MFHPSRRPPSCLSHETLHPFSRSSNQNENKSISILVFDYFKKVFTILQRLKNYYFFFFIKFDVVNFEYTLKNYAVLLFMMAFNDKIKHFAS